MDWALNAAVNPTTFCGFVEEDEECGKLGFSTCKTRNPRGAFVHWGFREHLRKIVRSEQWQTDIRPNLGKCSAVYVGGSSLGAAAANLFTAPAGGLRLRGRLQVYVLDQ